MRPLSYGLMGAAILFGSTPPKTLNRLKRIMIITIHSTAIYAYILRR